MIFSLLLQILTHDIKKKRGRDKKKKKKKNSIDTKDGGLALDGRTEWGGGAGRT